jgi:hypothetical protein
VFTSPLSIITDVLWGKKLQLFSEITAKTGNIVEKTLGVTVDFAVHTVSSYSFPQQLLTTRQKSCLIMAEKFLNRDYNLMVYAKAKRLAFNPVCHLFRRWCCLSGRLGAL